VGWARRVTRGSDRRGRPRGAEFPRLRHGPVRIRPRGSDARARAPARSRVVRRAGRRPVGGRSGAARSLPAVGTSRRPRSDASARTVPALELRLGQPGDTLRLRRAGIALLRARRLPPAGCRLHRARSGRRHDPDDRRAVPALAAVRQSRRRSRAAAVHGRRPTRVGRRRRFRRQQRSCACRRPVRHGRGRHDRRRHARPRRIADGTRGEPDHAPAAGCSRSMFHPRRRHHHDRPAGRDRFAALPAKSSGSQDLQPAGDRSTGGPAPRSNRERDLQEAGLGAPWQAYRYLSRPRPD
jgi:hypothetical protein